MTIVSADSPSPHNCAAMPWVRVPCMDCNACVPARYSQAHRMRMARCGERRGCAPEAAGGSLYKELGLVGAVVFALWPDTPGQRARARREPYGAGDCAY